MIKKFKPKVLVLISAMILSAAVTCAAQTQQLPTTGAIQQATPQNNNQASPKPANLLQLLNLSPDQLQQIRAINQEMRENVRAANTRLRDARRALDAAIYADLPNQAAVDDRAQELGEAQTEAIKARVAVEFRIRQILTAEQLVRFRDLRRQFEQKLKNQMLLQKKTLRQLNNKPL